MESIFLRHNHYYDIISVIIVINLGLHYFTLSIFHDKLIVSGGNKIMFIENYTILNFLYKERMTILREILEAIKNRRSIRKYKKLEVPQDKISTVLEAANWAPSNGNSQPWEFFVVKGDYVQKISKIFYDWAKDYIPNAPYIPAEKKPAMLEYAKDFGGAPVYIVVTYEVYDDAIKTEEALMATSAAIQNLSLAATEQGLGTVWIAGHVAHAQETRNILKLSNNRKVAGIIPIGYPDIKPPAPPRKDPDLIEKVTWLGF